MSIRTRLGNWLIRRGRGIGRKEGESELAVILSDHSIKTRMVDTDRDDLAWDHNLYRHGNVFIQDYANPIKPRVDHDPELQNSDEIQVDPPEDAHEDEHVQMISSNRFASFMKQQLIESLLNPREQWRLILYAIVGVAVLQFVTIIGIAMTSGAV